MGSWVCTAGVGGWDGLGCIEFPGSQDACVIWGHGDERNRAIDSCHHSVPPDPKKASKVLPSI